MGRAALHRNHRRHGQPRPSRRGISGDAREHRAKRPDTDQRLRRICPAAAPTLAHQRRSDHGDRRKAVFTTQHATKFVPGLRTAARTQTPTPQRDFVRCDVGVQSPCIDGQTDGAPPRGCVGSPDPLFDELQGTISIPVFQQGTRPYSTPGDGAILFDTTGTRTACSRNGKTSAA